MRAAQYATVPGEGEFFLSDRSLQAPLRLTQPIQLFKNTKQLLVIDSDNQDARGTARYVNLGGDSQKIKAMDLVTEYDAQGALTRAEFFIRR